MMYYVATLICLMAANAQALTPMAASKVENFLIYFRKTLLEKVALEVNNTVDLAGDLKVMVDNCKPIIEAQTAACKQCALNKCKVTPQFEDYLSLANPYLYLKEPLDDIGSKLHIAVNLLGDKAGGLYNSLQGLGTNMNSELAPVFKTLKIGLNAIKDAFKDLGDIVIDTSKIIGDSFKDLGDILSGKRRRRAIDAETKACMMQCADCTPLLKDTEADIITAVCGPEIVATNTTINSQLAKIQAVYDAALDEKNVIVLKIEHTGIWNAAFELIEVYLTVNLNGAVTKYLSAVTYPLMSGDSDTATYMAMEYWGKVVV